MGHNDTADQRFKSWQKAKSNSVRAANIVCIDENDIYIAICQNQGCDKK